MKLPFTFNIKLVFRLILPGFILSLSFLPIVKTALDSISVSIKIEYILMLSTLILGWLFTILDMNIYMLAEGRRYWPQWLRNIFLNAEKNRLQKLLQEYDKAKKDNHVKYVELSAELRKFPLNEEGDEFVIYPTRIGNLIIAYENYPLRVYGMDSIFYWYRIWLAIDENLRESIDNQQAIADSSLYTTVALYISSLCMVIYFISLMLPIETIRYLPEAPIILFASLASAVCGYAIYRLSLHLHSTCGELYKSMFDIYRDKVPVGEIVKKVTDLTNNHENKSYEKYKIAWRYLHNDRIKTTEGVQSATKIFNKKDSNF